LNLSAGCAGKQDGGRGAHRKKLPVFIRTAPDLLPIAVAMTGFALTIHPPAPMDETDVASAARSNRQLVDPRDDHPQVTLVPSSSVIRAGSVTFLRARLAPLRVLD